MNSELKTEEIDQEYTKKGAKNPPELKTKDRGMLFFFFFFWGGEVEEGVNLLTALRCANEALVFVLVEASLLQRALSWLIAFLDHKCMCGQKVIRVI